MAGVHVVCDGTVALPRDADQSFGITIVPQAVVLSEQRWHVGVDLSAEAWVTRLAADASPATAPAASSEALLEAYQRILGWGVEVVSLHPPEPLHGAVVAARSALARLPAGAPVSVVETPGVGAALGLLAIHAALAGADGATRAQVVKRVGQIAGGLHFWLVAPAGASSGGPAAPVAGGTMVVRELLAGTLDAVATVSSPIEGLRYLIDRVAEAVAADVPAHFGVQSAQADAEAAALATFLESRHLPAEIWIAPADPFTATLTRAGAFGLGLYSG
jgi:fatty acid-binding protein DegV